MTGTNAINFSNHSKFGSKLVNGLSIRPLTAFYS